MDRGRQAGAKFSHRRSRDGGTDRPPAGTRRRGGSGFFRQTEEIVHVAHGGVRVEPARDGGIPIIGENPLLPNHALTLSATSDTP